MPYEQFIFERPSTQHDGKKVFLVDTKAEPHPYFSDLMTRGINKTLRQGGSVIIVCNKNSYAKGTICDQCGHIPQCKQCDISISYHKPGNGDGFGMCHICKSYYKPTNKCPQCKQGTMKTYGLGIQQVAEHIEQTHHIKPLIINSSTANSLPKIDKIKETADPSSSQARVIIATSLITTASLLTSDDPVSGLTILLHADAPLALPDYQASSNCFHLIHDTITMSPHQHIIIQTQKPDHPIIRLACAGQVAQFHAQDSTWKQQHHYPPYGDICVLIYKNEVESNVFTTINKLYQELLYLKENRKSKNENQQGPPREPLPTSDISVSSTDIQIYATPPLIYKAYNKYRYHIIIRGTDIRPFVEDAFTRLKIPSRGFKIDWQAREIV